MPFEVGDKVQHRYNRDLGPGEIVEIASGRMRVRFPRDDVTLEFAAGDGVFEPFHVDPARDPDRWHESPPNDLVERLARLESDPFPDWKNRMAASRLAALREADGLGSFLGGRITLHPHQLYVAEQAVRTDPVRWLLADEVGLGKTVEACLILNRLVRTRRAERVVVVAPSSLTVQWLGELYRKFHQNFVLLDTERVADVATDFGSGFNPFDAHARVVVALELLCEDDRLQRHLVDAPPDLCVVDEAHRLERRCGHPGSPAYRALAPVLAGARHALLLSATPVEADAHGFFRLLELLRPGEFSSWDAFRDALDRGVPIVPCASSTRRDDIGGLPPRRPCPTRCPVPADVLAREREIRAGDRSNALARRRRAEELESLLATPWGETDPRLEWILAEERRWHERGDKMLVFVHARETLTHLKKRLEGATFRRVAVFHEDLSPAARDLEVAQFASTVGSTVLISTESGGEGRNFEFCRGIVLFDLPWDPVLVEQRIGRLDRISRTTPVDIHYFVPQGGFGRDVVELYEALGIFEAPLGGLDRSLGHVRDAIVSAVCGTADTAPSSRSHDGGGAGLDVEAIVSETLRLRARVNSALYTDLHEHRYRGAMADDILARIPPELDSLNATVVLGACRRYGFDVVDKGEVARWYVEFGNEATVEHVPGMTEGTRLLGTFDRAEAVRNESLEFFAAGHPLVEGVLLEIEDGARGRILLADVTVPPGADVPPTFLVVALVDRVAGAPHADTTEVPGRAGAGPSVIVTDLTGVPRPEWREHVLEDGGATWRPVDLRDWGLGPDDARARAEWSAAIRSLGPALEALGRFQALAVVRAQSSGAAEPT